MSNRLTYRQGRGSSRCCHRRRGLTGTGQQATTTFDLLGHRGCYGSGYRSLVSDDSLSDRSWLFNYQRGNLGYNHCRSRFFNCRGSWCLDSNGFRCDRGRNFCNHWLVDNRYLGFFSNYRFGYHWLCGHDCSLLVSLGHNGFRHDMLGQRSRGLQGGGNRFSTGDGDDRDCWLFHFHLGGICLGSCSQGRGSAFGRLFFIFTLAAGIFIDALATLAFDTLIARRTAGTTLAFGLLIVLLYCVGGLFGNNRSIGGQGGNVAGRDIDPDLLAQLTAFAALSHFLLFFQTRLVVDHGVIDGFYRVNDHFGARFTRSTGLTSRARGAGFAFLTRLTSLARFTFHALFTHFATDFTFLARLTLFAGATVAAFTTFTIGTRFPLLCGIGRAAVTTVVITTTTLTTAAGFIALMTMTLILACFALGCRFVGRSLHVGRGGVGTEQT